MERSRRLAVCRATAALLTCCSAVATPARGAQVDLMARASVAARSGEVNAQPDALDVGAHSAVTWYVPLAEGSSLRGRSRAVAGGASLRLQGENGATLSFDDAATGRDFDLDLRALGAGLTRITLTSGPAASTWQRLRVEWPATQPSTEGVSAIRRGPADVLIVLFDSLRADETEPYGRARGQTPEIAKLAQAGVTFAGARAPSSWTRPSVASLLTSQSPATHEISLLSEGLARAGPFLPEVLARAGYHTVSVTHSSQVSPNLGFGRGYAQVKRLYKPFVQARYQKLATPGERADFVFERGVRPAIEAAQGRHWFVYLHEMDPHYPYDPMPPYDAGSAQANGEESSDDTDLERARYRGEIRFMDAFLGSLLERLRAAQGDRETLVIFVSDHGDAFREHGAMGHAHSVYEELLRVPVIFQMPSRLPAGRRIASPMDLTDVAPTVLDLLGVDPPPATQGSSLLRWIEAGPADAVPRSFLAESLGRAQIALRHGHWKLIRVALGVETTQQNRTLGQLHDVDSATTKFRTLLFDLETDPGERRDVSAEQPLVAAALDQLLRWELLQREPGEGSEPSEATLDRDELEQLEALGYIE